MWESASEITWNQENSEEPNDLRDMQRGDTNKGQLGAVSSPRGSRPRKKAFL